MLLKAIDSLTLSVLDVAAADTLVTNQSRPVERDARRRASADGPIFTGSASRAGEWQTIIKCPNEAATDAVLVALDGEPDDERRLLFDRGGSEVVGWATARRVERINAYDLRVVFEPTDPLVTDAAVTTTSKSLPNTTDQAVQLTVPGNRRTAPVVRLQPNTQRSAPTSAVGWTYRTRWGITNGATESLYRYPVRLSLGDTTPLTTTKAQADGDDLRVWINGLEVARTLDDWDTAASYVWFLIPALPPGETLVVDVVYGNSAAVNPPVLAYPDLPPFDLTTSTNAQWVYQVSTVAANAGKGGWYLSSGTSNPTTDQEVPGAWRNILTFENPDNTDDCCNRKVTSYTDSGTKYIGIFNATRARGGALDLPDEGLADGVTIHNPLGISSVEAELIYENDDIHGDASGGQIGKFVILTRNSGAEVWNILFSDSSQDNTPTTIATATYTPAAAVKHLAFAVWPRDEDKGEVDQKAKQGRKINCQWDDVLNLNINSAALTITQTENEVEVYELATELRVGGHGSGASAAYHAVRVGNAQSESGVGTPHVACELSEWIVVECERRRVSVWDSGLANEMESVPAPACGAVAGTVEADGTTGEYPATDWLPMRPAVNPLTNATFASGIAGWSILTTGAGMTAALSGVAGALRLTISPSTAAPGVFTTVASDDFIPLNGRTWVWVAMDFTTSDADLEPDPAIYWYTAAGTLISAVAGDDWVAPAGSVRRRYVAGKPPAGATKYRVGFVVTDNAGSQTGTIDLDNIVPDGSDLIVADVAMGAIDVEVDVAGRWVP